jgi:diketogulonate reductase-like aldo/keto reductase
MIRWHLQEGRSAIPKSVRPERIAENSDVFGFELTAEEPPPIRLSFLSRSQTICYP